MPTLKAEIAGLTALGAPIVCFDTCSVLDIMRDPITREIRAHEQQAAHDIVSAMETRTNLVGLIAEQVQFEFNNHVGPIGAEAKRALENLRKQLVSIETVAAVFDVTGRTDLAHLDEYLDRTRALANRLIAAATLAPASPEISDRAVRRVVQARTPARKGKQSVTDCLVIETYLEIVSSLRGAGLTSKSCSCRRTRTITRERPVGC